MKALPGIAWAAPVWYNERPDAYCVRREHI